MLMLMLMLMLRLVSWIECLCKSPVPFAVTWLYPAMTSLTTFALDIRQAEIVDLYFKIIITTRLHP